MSDRPFFFNLLPLRMCHRTRRDEHTDSKTLRPQTRLHNLYQRAIHQSAPPFPKQTIALKQTHLLRHRLIPIPRDQAKAEAQAERPAAEDEPVLVAQRKVVDLLAHRERIPVALGTRRDGVELGLAAVVPVLALERLAGVLGGDDEAGDDDENDAERFEARREVAVVGPAPLEGVGDGEGDGGAGEEAFEAAHDCGVLLGVELFF